MAPSHCTDRVNIRDRCTLHCESQSRLYGWVRVCESHGRKVNWSDGCEITSWVARLSIASNRDMLLSFAAPCVLECSAVLSGLGGYVSPFPSRSRVPNRSRQRLQQPRPTIGGVWCLAKRLKSPVCMLRYSSAVGHSKCWKGFQSTV
jgi:hypothetical protein